MNVGATVFVGHVPLDGGRTQGTTSPCLPFWAGLNLEVTVPSPDTCDLARAGNRFHWGPVITPTTRKVTATKWGRSFLLLRHNEHLAFPVPAPIQSRRLRSAHPPTKSNQKTHDTHSGSKLIGAWPLLPKSKQSREMVLKQLRLQSTRNVLFGTFLDINILNL